MAATSPAALKCPAGARARSGALCPPSPSTAWQRAQPLSKKAAIPALGSPGTKYPPVPWARAPSPTALARKHKSSSCPARARPALAMAAVAVIVHFPLLVAVQTGVHVEGAEGAARRLGARLHGTVALGALQPAERDVAPVGEVDVPRHPRDLVPGNLLAGCGESAYLFFFRAFGHGLLVAHQAGVESGQGGLNGVAGAAVAVRAGHAAGDMHRMVVADGLRRRGVGRGAAGARVTGAKNFLRPRSWGPCSPPSPSAPWQSPHLRSTNNCRPTTAEPTKSK